MRHGAQRGGVPGVDEAAVVGAWEELVDAYVDHRMIAGDRGPRSRTAERTGREAATRLAGTVDAAVFSDSPVTEADRAAAWSIVDAERRSLTRGAGLGARLRAALVPRSFLRHLGRESAEPATLAVVRDHAGPGIPDVGSAAIEDAALEQAGIDGAAGADEART